MQAASHRLPLDVIKLEITEPILWIVRISPIAVVKVALERKLYGGCMDSFVGVVIEPCGIDVLHHLNYFGFKKAKLWFLKIIECLFIYEICMRLILNWVCMQQAMPECLSSGCRFQSIGSEFNYSLPWLFEFTAVDHKYCWKALGII